MIRISRGSPDQFRELADILRAFAEGHGTELLIHRLPGVIAEDGVEVTAKVREPPKGVERVGHNKFEAVQSREDWNGDAEKVAALSVGRHGHFNWLCDFGQISLLVSPDGGW